MKRLLLAATLLIGTIFATASNHSVTAPSGSHAGTLNTLDTLTNADADTLYLNNVAGVKSVVTFQVNFTKISGTVAGTIKYFASIGGGHYKLVQTDTLSDASGVFGYSFIPSTANNYMVVVTTTGTSVSSYTGRYLYR